MPPAVLWASPSRSIEGDSSDAQSPTVGTQTIDRELGANVDAIVGAASSAVTLNVIDKVTSAGVVMFSPANTSKKLSTYPDKGLYFRDAPSDILQGQVLGEVVSEDNVSTVGLLVLNDAYGTGLADDFTTSFQGSGGQGREEGHLRPEGADLRLGGRPDQGRRTPTASS